MNAYKKSEIPQANDEMHKDTEKAPNDEPYNQSNDHIKLRGGQWQIVINIIAEINEVELK